MHSQSLCDCYCKTQEPLTRQREQIHSEKSRARNLKSFASKFPKPESSRNAKKIPLIPAKVINDEQLDTKRSTVTFPASPDLSPETSAVLEDVEKLIKDAQIQMKEISMTTSGGRLRKCVNVYPDEASLDDENDQLLYIRERVACKFQEANGWFDSTSYTDSKLQRFSNEKYVSIDPKRLVDLSAPKFKTLQDRCKDFSRERKLEAQKLGFPASLVDDRLGNDGKSKSNDQASSAAREVERNSKIGTCSVQMGASVNIKGELKVQNLEDIHISPDPSFVQENQNVATYIVRHDFGKRNASPKRREKFVKIVEHTRNDDDDNYNSDRGSMNDGVQRINSKDREEIQNSSHSDLVSGKMVNDIISEESRDVAKESNGKFVESSERTIEAEKPVVTIFRNEKYLESIASKDISDRSDRDENLRIGENEPIQDVSNVKHDIDVRNEQTNGSSVRIIHRNERKQVRFDERALETGNGENYIESQSKGESVVHLEQDLGIPTRSNDLEIQKAPKDDSETPSKNLHVPLSSKDIEETHVNNKKRYKEIHEKRKTEQEERYKTIDERFTNIVRTYCNGDHFECSKINDGHVISFASTNSTEASDESDEFYNLYEPSTNELDNVLTAYNKVIDNVVRSTKAIDEFLSRPEMEEYRVENTTKPEAGEKSLTSTSQGRKKVEKKKANTELRTNDSIVKHRLPVTNEKWNFRSGQIKTGQENAPLKKSVITKEDKESKLKRIVSKSSDKFPARSNSKTKDRDRALGRSAKEETTESSENYTEDSKIMELGAGKQIMEKDSSILTTSSTYPHSSSSETKAADDTKLSLEFSKSTIKDDAADPKSNTVESEKRNIEKRNFDYRAMSNVVCSRVLKQVCPEAKRTEEAIARVVREETRLVEDKIKNMFNVDEIVALIVKSLLENFKSEKSNFGTKELELFITENVSLSDATCVDDRMETIETARSNDDTEKNNLQTECTRSEENRSAMETIKCDEENVEKSDSSRSGLKGIVISTSTHDSKDRSSLISNENVSRFKNENSMKLGEADGKLNSDIESSKEYSDAKSSGACDEANSAKKDDEKIVSLDNERWKTKENSRENFDFPEIRAQTIGEHRCGDKEYQTVDTLEENGTSLGKINEMETLNTKHSVVADVKNVQLTIENEATEDLLPKGSINSNEKLFSSNDAVNEAGKEKSVESCSIEKTGKAAATLSGNNFSQKASPSDSLHDCVSLRSSSRNISKTSSSNAELSQEVKEITQVPETRNLIDGGVTNTNSSRFDNTFDKEKILLDVYDEVHRKFLSSTFESNYSSVLKQHRLCSGVSTISTVESSKTEMSSDTSHSEGELYLPSSGSYSLGEIRMMTKNRSDGEDTDDFDDNIAIFVTREMLTSWNESSKSLIQSMGEI